MKTSLIKILDNLNSLKEELEVLENTKDASIDVYHTLESKILNKKEANTDGCTPSEHLCF
jgi:hypothetical protein